MGNEVHAISNVKREIRSGQFQGSKKKMRTMQLPKQKKKVMRSMQQTYHEINAITKQVNEKMRSMQSNYQIQRGK